MARKYKKSVSVLLLGFSTLLALISPIAISPGAISAQTVSSPAIDPRAQQLFDRTVQALSNAQGLSFQAAITFDDLAPNGLKLQYNSNAQAFVNRRNQFQINYLGDRRDTSFIYDGRDFTLVDRGNNVYGSFAEPRGTNAVLNRVVEDFSFLVPLTDFIYNNPGQLIKPKIQAAYFLGPVQLGSKTVQHLAFQQENINWQVWIEDGPTPMIQKLVIDNKNVPGNPQYSIVFSNWNFNWQPPQGNFFKAVPPADAVKIDFLGADS